MSSLKQLVDVREIDLIIIASGVGYTNDWPEKTHVICFSPNIDTLPGPFLDTYLKISANAETEKFLFPDLHLPLNRRREADYSNLVSVRG